MSEEKAAIKHLNIARQLQSLTQMSQLEADESSGLTVNWSKSGMTAYQIINRYQKNIVMRARVEAINNDIIKQFIRACKMNIPGSDGVQLNFECRTRSGKLDVNLNDALKMAWNIWCDKDNADIRGKSNLVQMQHKAILSGCTDGEWMDQIFQSTAGGDAGPYGFSINQIDAQRCPIDYDLENGEDGKFTRHGVELNKFGRPLNFNVNDSNGRMIYDGYYDTSPYSRLVPVKASDMLHGFIDELPAGQVRGMPWVTSALLRLHMLRQFETAISVNAAVNSRPSGAMKMPEDWIDETQLTEDEKEQLYTLMGIQLGEFRKIPNGAELLSIPNEFPKNDPGPFIKALLRMAASGMGVNYNTLANDGEGVNYSTMRHFAISDRDHWQCMQDLFICSWFRPLLKRWLKYALLSGKVVTKSGRRVPASQYDKILNSIKIKGREWGWVDPEKEEKAASEAQGRFRKAASDIVGDKFEETIKKIGDDLDVIERETKLPRVAAAMIYFKDKDIANVFISKENQQDGKDPEAAATADGSANSEE